VYARNAKVKVVYPAIRVADVVDIINHLVNTLMFISEVLIIKQGVNYLQIHEQESSCIYGRDELQSTYLINEK